MNFLLTEAWMFSGTIKKNILFGLDYDEQKFFQCISATALEEVSVFNFRFDSLSVFVFTIILMLIQDLSNLSHGVKTIIGDDGVVLSGGQKARLFLTRALYRDGDIYLLDDPLSSADVEIARHLFKE